MNAETVSAAAAANAAAEKIITVETANDAESSGASDENTCADTGRTYIAAAVYNEAINPCRILPIIYGFKESPERAVTAITWKCTLIPENPTINEVITNFS